MHNTTERKVIIATTFRDFRGTENDLLQLEFLKSLKQQTHTNWVLVVTLFGEKNVTATLENEGVPHIVRDGNAGTDRFSLTEVLRNAREVALQYPDSIVLWTTCDIYLDTQFFEVLATEARSGTCGTSYPHTHYSSVAAQQKREGGTYFWSGLDAIFFSTDVLTNEAIPYLLTKYPNNGWGAGEFYFTALGMKFAKRMINIYPVALSKVANNRSITDETQSFLSETNVRNRGIVSAMAKELALGPTEMRLWFLKYRFPSYSLHPMRFCAWFMIRFRIHLLGIRYRILKLFRIS